MLWEYAVSYGCFTLGYNNCMKIIEYLIYLRICIHRHLLICVLKYVSVSNMRLNAFTRIIVVFVCNKSAGILFIMMVII